MKPLIPVLVIILFMSCKSERESRKDLLQTENVQLSIPRIMVDSMLFKKDARVKLQFDVAESEIYYKLDNGDIKLYDQEIVVKESTRISVQSRKPEYISSAWEETMVLKVKYKLKGAKVRMTPAADKSYPGNGADALIDLKKGNLDLKSNLYWSGFKSEEVSVRIDFQKEKEIEKLFVSLLSDENSWIFLPKEIQVEYKEKMLSIQQVTPPIKRSKAAIKIIPVALPSNTYEYLIIKIISHKKIPDWHVGKGAVPWLFVDEIFFN